ncbi:hypothetical protein [Nocardia fusca]|uniref:DUF8020 domain-containing protein n=1 Tax=Nocardia fusca TaxID=941183 RepID=A0ABV3FGL9_9NOCA
MNIRRWTATAILAASAVTVSSGVTAAEPAQPDAAATSSVRYQSVMYGDAVVTVLESGAFSLDADGTSVTARDADGQVLASIPLSFELGGQQHRINGRISPTGHALLLAPDVVATPVASPLENQRAGNDFAAKLGQAGMAGPFGGAAVGAIIGLVVAVASCAILTIACLVTALPIVGAFAAGGGVVGTILLTGGTVLTAGWNYLQTLQAPPGQSAYAQQGLNGAGVPDANFRFPPLAIGTGSSSGSGSGSGG